MTIGQIWRRLAAYLLLSAHIQYLAGSERWEVGFTSLIAAMTFLASLVPGAVTREKTALYPRDTGTIGAAIILGTVYSVLGYDYIGLFAVVGLVAYTVIRVETRRTNEPTTER